MRELKGISASPGIVIGRVFYYLDENITVPDYPITQEDVEEEIERYQVALQKSEQEILQLKETIPDNLEEGRFLDSHILMLKDHEFNKQVVNRIRKQQKNSESMLYSTALEHIQRFKELKDTYLRERTVDFYDVTRRVLNHLLYRERISLADLQEEVILVTHNLMPSDVVAMDKEMVKGIAMDVGGKTSHTAILARAIMIPAVLGLSNITSHVRNGDEIIVDGSAGKVIISPDSETLQHYSGLLKELQLRDEKLLAFKKERAKTTDGKEIRLYANVEIPEETESIDLHGAEGIGLFRSEFLFLSPGGVSSEEDQYRVYRRVVESMGERPVVIRTLDVGGDKLLESMAIEGERNPLLGWRAIRYCLSHRDLFRAQLRALLRASVHGNLKVMFPLVSGVEELDILLSFFDEVKCELRKEGIPQNEDTKVGIMIEVPSAAITTDILAGMVDFISIGTNDLIQYTIAVDRGNEKVAYLYEPFHPAVLRLLGSIIDAAHSAAIPVSICGEMAGDPMAVVILIGLGLDSLSMSSLGIPEIKRIIRSVSLSEAESLVNKIMTMTSHNEIEGYVQKWMYRRFDFL